MRVVLAGETVVDSTSAILVSESGQQPAYYFPVDDVPTALLIPTGRLREDAKGTSTRFDLRAGDRTVKDGAWTYSQPSASCDRLRGHIAFQFRAVDRWLEEDQEVFEHPKDPYHRIDAYPSSRHVRIFRDGELLADSTRAVALFESNLPTRWYLPVEDTAAKLVPSDTTTGCGYKGVAHYFHVRLQSGELLHDMAWFYPEPLSDGLAVRDLLCLFNEQVDIELDGTAQDRPETPWSAGATAGEV